MPIKIAITGGIGSGKSAVGNYLQELGYPVFSCDEIYKTIIISPEYIQKVQAVFPECIEKGDINRKILAKIVFQDAEKLQKLNDIAHPLIMKELDLLMSETKMDVAFAEVPVLFEGHYENQFDKIIVVQRNVALRMESVSKRDGLTAQEIESRIQAQFNYSKLEDCRLDNLMVIENNESLDCLKKSVDNLLIQLTKQHP